MPNRSRHPLRACAVALFLCLGNGAAAQPPTVEEIDAQARSAFIAGDFETSARLAQQVYEILRGRLPPDDIELATASLNVGIALQRGGRHAEAAPYIETACASAAAQRGDTHPMVGSCLLGLAEALAHAGQATRGQEVAARALGVIEASLPAADFAAAVFHAGEFFRDAGAAEPALRYFQQAASLFAPPNLAEPAFLATSLTEAAQL